jgi:hypothetical protein
MEYFYLISGDYIGEKLSDDYSENFANGFNEIILKGLIVEQTKIYIIFIITEIVNFNYYDYTNDKVIVLGDKLKIEWESKFNFSDKKIYYKVNSVENNKIDISSNISLLCSEDMYNDILLKDKYSELTYQLNKIEFDNLTEKNYLIDLLLDYIEKIK